MTCVIVREHKRLENLGTNWTKKMKSPHLCPTPYCRRPKAKKKGLCSRCGMRLWRAANPMQARLSNLRGRAKKKKLEFDLDLEWLVLFCDSTGYDPAEHHIDRISVLKGYVKGNLQVLPYSDNIAKGNRERGKQLQML